MAIDPFIRQIYNSIDITRNGWTRVCADDIGCVLRGLAHLARLLPIFKVAQRFAGLHLKPAKCVIVPLGNKFSDQLRDTLQQWLRHNIPLWEFFTISATGKYLGFALGPSACNETWTRPLRAWKQRAVEVATAAAPPVVSILEYNCQCMSVLSYVAQLAMPPPDLHRKELATMTKVLHLPPSSLTRDAVIDLENVGLPRVLGIEANAAAIRLRTALKTIPGWQTMHGQLIDAWESEAPLSYAFIGEQINYTVPPFDYPPFVRNLFHAVSQATNDETTFTASTAYPQVVRRFHALPAVVPLMQQRLAKHFPASRWHLADFARFDATLKRGGGHLALSTIRACIGSWCTSHRMREQRILLCLFGCPDPAQDSHFHYMECPILWHLIDSFLTTKNVVHKRLCACCGQVSGIGSTGPTDVENIWFNRVGVSASNFLHLQSTMLACDLYHSLKLHAVNEITAVLQSGGSLSAVLQSHLHASFSRCQRP